jgi:MoaA/NifB/PqqE/SkfB family radical SAM enzyme
MRLTGGRPVLQVHPARRCNLTCAHCYSDSGPQAADEIPWPVLAALVTDAAALGYQALAVSGGEPLMYPRLPALLGRAREAGLHCSVVSNGTLLTARRLDALAGSLDLLVLSLDGPRPEHDRMRGRDGAYDAMSRRIEAVRAAGIPFGFLFTLTQHNVHQLEWAAGFAAASGAALLQVHPLEASGRGRALADAVPDAIEMSYALLEVGRLGRQFGPGLRLHLDLAATGALAELLRALADDDGSGGGGKLSQVLSPLVVEPDGWCVPLTYGFPRAFALGNLNQGRLSGLAQPWMAARLPALRDVACDLARQLGQPGTPPVINAFERLTGAALAAAGQAA